MGYISLPYLHAYLLSYRRETALQDALSFSPKVEDCMGDNILRTL